MLFTDDEDQMICHYTTTKNIYDPKDLFVLQLVCYIFVRYFLLRGRQEQREMKWLNVCFGKYSCGHELAGKNYVKLVGLEDKLHKIYLSKYNIEYNG